MSSAAKTVYVDTDGTGNYNCKGTNDHVEINKALTYIDSLGGGTVYLRGPNTYWIDSTLYIGGNTVLTGDSSAEIKLVKNAGWSKDVPMITNIRSDDDITITGFIIDGNSENQCVSLGRGYYNMIYFNNADNTEVSNMRLEWGCGDGLKVRKASNIVFTNNDVYKLGHDALYALGCSNVEFAYNTVFTRTNSACRYSDGCIDSTIHDNLIYSSNSGDSTGPAIQIGTSSTSSCVFDDIEIYNNRIHSIKGAGIWMSANYQDNVIHAKDVYIHHNTFTKVGQYSTNTGFSNAAIVLGDFDNTIIENNVFDDDGHAAIKYFLRDGRRQQQTQFTTYVRNNIIMNCDAVSSVTGSGVGIWNTESTYSKFVVQNNDIYNNKNGQTYGSGFTMSNNLNINPLCVDSTNSNAGSRDYHLKSKAGHYSNGKWVADSSSSALIDAGYPGSSYSKEPSPSGGRINIGRYGNTIQESKSGTKASKRSDYPPVPTIVLYKNTTQNFTVTFDASSSTDDIGIVSYSWDFDESNGISSDATGMIVYNKYWTAGNYIVTLTVSDTSGQESSTTLQIAITGNTTKSLISSENSSGIGNETSFNTTYDKIHDIHLPSYDNRLCALLENLVLSNSTYIDVGKGSSLYRDVMLFDLGMYNTTDILSNATLSLYWYYPSNTTRRNDTVVEVYRPFAWDAKYVSWNCQNFTDSWITPGGNWSDHKGNVQGNEPYASITFESTYIPDNRYYDFNVTQLVQEYINGTYENTGFFLKARNESGNYIAFYSSDWSNESQKPKLTIAVDKPPIANAGFDMTTVVGLNITFNGSLSTDDNGNVSYSWDFDAVDGITTEATGVTATKIYSSVGNHTVTLTVTDTKGQTSSDTLEVTVRKPLISISYTAAYDNRLRESSSGSVLSDSSYIDIGKSEYRCRDLLWFNLSSYNTTDIIYNATLSLYWYYPENSTRRNDTIVDIYRPIEWDPAYVNWNYRLSDTLWNTKGGDWFDKNGISQGHTPYASRTFAATDMPDNRYYEFDVTQLVKDYVSGKYKNTGFFLKGRNEGNNYIAFYGSEWSNTSQIPKLTVIS